MTEAEWLACTDPKPMLEFLRGKASDRKLRLFAVSCLPKIGSFDNRIAAALQTVERYADGKATWTELSEARKTLRMVRREAMPSRGRVRYGAGAVARVERAAHPSISTALDTAVMCYDSVTWVREIFGNPLRPVAVETIWLTPAIVGLAQCIYDDRAFDRLPILADALVKVGCTDADILGHCRGPDAHVRGCWVVDLLLGKE